MSGPCQHPGKKGGGATGPEPTNRAKPGTKRPRAVDRTGTPLAVRLTGANRPDSIPCAALLDAIPRIRQPNGHRRKRPATLHAENAYDLPRRRQALRSRRITSRIARKGIDASARRGRHRWVVERTLAWLNRFRRLTIRDDLHHAFVSLGGSLMCFNTLNRFC